MRAAVFATAFATALFTVACSPGAPSAEQKPAAAQAPASEKVETVPSDVPIPIGLVGRKDSTQPGTKFFVVQGQIQSTLPDAATAIRQQVVDAGWTAVGEPVPSADDSAETLAFEKDARSLKITLVKVQNTVTGMNLLTGPK